MVRILSLLLLIFSSTAFAGGQNPIPAAASTFSLGSNVQGGGISAGNLGAAPACLTLPTFDSTYFTIEMGLTATAGDFYRLYKNGAAYQVTNGSSFHAVCYCWAVGTASTVKAWQFASSQTSWADGASSLTSGTFQFGAAANYGPVNINANAYNCTASTYSFPSQAFTGVQLRTTDSYHIWVVGKETTP